MQAQLIAYLLQQLSSETEAMVLQVEGNQIPLEHLDDTWWAASGNKEVASITLRTILHYYTSVSPYLLPLLQDRPMTVRYFQPGKAGRLERYWRGEVPPFVQIAEIFHEATNDNEQVILVQNLSILLWFVSQGGIEFYPWLSRITPETGLPNIFINSVGTLDLSVLNYPDYLVFRMDPPLLHIPALQEQPLFVYNPDLINVEPSIAPAVDTLKQAAQAVRQSVEELKLAALPYLDGKGGIYIFIPIKRKYTFTQVREAAKALRERAIAEFPDLLTSEWQVSERQGKVFVQVDENSRGKLVTAPFSLQVNDEPVVAWPCGWQRLSNLSSLHFTLAEVMAVLHTAPIPPWPALTQAAKDLPEVLLATSG